MLRHGGLCQFAITLVSIPVNDFYFGDAFYSALC